MTEQDPQQPPAQGDDPTRKDPDDRTGDPRTAAAAVGGTPDVEPEGPGDTPEDPPQETES